MTKIIITLALLLTGCVANPTESITRKGQLPYPPPKTPSYDLSLSASDQMYTAIELVVDAIELKYGLTSTLEQRNELYELPLSIITQAEMNAMWPPDVLGECIARATDDGTWLVSSSNDDYDLGTLIHEYVHHAGVTLLRDPDNCHDDKDLFSCENSVEHLARLAAGLKGTHDSVYVCGVSSCL